jgi:hypothetical protein
MERYRIKIFSNTIEIISSLFLVLIFTCITILISRELDKVSVLLISLGLFAMVFWIPKMLSRGEIEIELNEESFRHIWIKKFLFSKETDIELEWREIVNYVYEADRQFDSFKLELACKRQYKISRWRTAYGKDDFVDFINAFPKYAENLNKVKNLKIEKGESFNELLIKWFMRTWAVIVLVILFFEVFYIGSLKDSVPLLIFLVIYMIYEYRVQTGKGEERRKESKKGSLPRK